jgi:hypothetical protein
MPLQDLYLIDQTDLPHQLAYTNRHVLGPFGLLVLRDTNEVHLDIVLGMRRDSIKLHAANDAKVIAKGEGFF